MDDYGFLEAFDEEASLSAVGASEADEADFDKKKGAKRFHIPEALIALGIAVLLAACPAMAHAAADADASASGNEDTSASAQASEDASSAAASGGSASKSSAKKSTKKEAGLSIAKAKEKRASGKTYSLSADGVAGVSALGGGTIVAGKLSVTTTGANSPALCAASADAGVSLVSSDLSTEGEGSPLLSGAGRIELEDLSGTAKTAGIAELASGSRVIVSNSTLASEFAGLQESNSIVAGIKDAVSSTTSGSSSAAILISQPSTAGEEGGEVEAGEGDAAATAGQESQADAESESSKASAASAPADKAASAAEEAGSAAVPAAFFQATGSTFSASLESGALVRIDGADARLVFSNVELDFDSGSARLAESVNGASASFANYGQRIAGEIAADSSSSLDFYLLEASSWAGSSSVLSTTAGEAAASNITVNIDATSSWALTADSTVTNLNLAPGGKLVDVEGAAVKIVDADGNTLVDGASDIEVKVTGSFATTVATAGAGTLEDAQIDRAGYDAKFDANTSFGTNGEPTSPSVEDEVRELAARIIAWFENL